MNSRGVVLSVELGMILLHTSTFTQVPYCTKNSVAVFVFYLSIAILSVVEEVLRSFTEVKVATPQCKSTLLRVKVLHSKSYLSKSIKVLASKYT